MIRGPQEYVPSVEVEVVSRQKAIPLDENEGIYVRDIKTGKVYHYILRDAHKFKIRARMKNIVAEFWLRAVSLGVSFVNVAFFCISAIFQGRNFCLGSTSNILWAQNLMEPKKHSLKISR